MTIPVLRQGPLLIAALQPEPTDSDIRELTDRLLLAAGDGDVSGVILDLSTVDFVDSFLARSLRTVTGTLHLRGCRTAVSGIQPDVAITMARLGLALEGAITTLDLDAAIEALHREPRNVRAT